MILFSMSFSSAGHAFIPTERDVPAEVLARAAPAPIEMRIAREVPAKALRLVRSAVIAARAALEGRDDCRGCALVAAHRASSMLETVPRVRERQVITVTRSTLDATRAPFARLLRALARWTSDPTPANAAEVERQINALPASVREPPDEPKAGD